MKNVISLAVAASLASGTLAQPHAHQHNHRHVHQLMKRDAATCVTNYVAAATATVYVVGDKQISAEEAAKGLSDGVYVSVGETVPTFTPPPAPSSTLAAAEFKESPHATTSTTSTAAPSPSPKPPSSSNAAGTGLDASFPSGTIPCSQFPSAWGAIPVPWMNLGGWSGIQRTPGFKFRVDSAISYIETGIGGDGCTANSFCSYACPVGYQKLQWPTAQGATLQSIGGLFCNADGMLELTRPGVSQLCGKGAGGVFVKNDLDADCSVCRTDYPGTENMVVPLLASPGTTQPLTNPYSPDYYIWNNSPTTAQYYVNKKGYGLANSCVWVSPIDPIGAGNWAPVNIGVGKNAEGLTYLSIFANLPTSTAQLDYNIEITGDVSMVCSLINGVYSSGGNGCTVSLSIGQSRYAVN